VDRGKYRRERVRRFVATSKRHVLFGLACAALVFVIWYLLKYVVPGPTAQ
jgi:hypothetical protein